jgi:hypothetical protein
MRTVPAAILAASLVVGCRSPGTSGGNPDARAALAAAQATPDAGSDATDDVAADADGPRTLVEIASGGRHACGRSAEGDVFCWGANGSGQLGGAVATALRQMPSPRRVPGLTHVVSLASQGDATCAVRDDGSLWCWGVEELGAFGVGSKRTWDKPTRIAGVAGARQVSLGPGVGIVSTEGAVLEWGLNPAPPGAHRAGDDPWTPWVVPGIPNVKRVAVSLGAACAVLEGGTLVCWGALGVPGPASASPTPVRGITNAVDVQVSTRGGCVLRADGTVTCWGDNDVGQLGLPNRLPVKGLVRAHVSDAALLRGGNGDACVVNRGGALLCWGAHTGGGDGPFQMTAIVGTASVGIGSEEICASTSAAELWCAAYDRWASPRRVAW